jgi:tripartite-type tricarboxylate transporter receptor subunit TctC
VRAATTRPGPSKARVSFEKALRAWLGLAAAGLAMAAPPVLAETYPSQPIKFVIPFTAGGGTDVTARMLAEQMGPKLGQTIIADNRPGASAGLAAATVAKEKPNGYTLLIGTATLAANAVVDGPSSKLDLLNDFDYIGKIGQIDLILVVPAQLRIDTLAGLVNLMKTQPGKVQFGSPGIGSPAHLGGELLKLVTKTDALHIPYKGESAALNDLLGGQTTFQLCAPFVCAPRIQEGTLKGLAVTAKHRSKLVPNIPTSAEAGAPGVEAGTWYYIAAPKGTPAPIIKKLNAALNEVLADEKFKARLLAMGVEAEPGTTPEKVKGDLQAEMDKWRPVVKAAGITK